MGTIGEISGRNPPTSSRRAGSASVRWEFLRISEFAPRAKSRAYGYLGAGEHLMFHGPIFNSSIDLSVAAGGSTRIKLMSAGDVSGRGPSSRIGARDRHRRTFRSFSLGQIEALHSFFAPPSDQSEVLLRNRGVLLARET